mgnify:CR=1 FL=1
MKRFASGSKPAPIMPIRAAAPAKPNKVHLADADRVEISALNAQLAKALQTLGRARLDTIKGNLQPVMEMAAAIDAFRAEERVIKRIHELGTACGIDLANAPEKWTFDFEAMTFTRDVPPDPATLKVD